MKGGPPGIARLLLFARLDQGDCATATAATAAAAAKAAVPRDQQAPRQRPARGRAVANRAGTTRATARTAKPPPEPAKVEISSKASAMAWLEKRVSEETVEERRPRSPVASAAATPPPMAAAPAPPRRVSTGAAPAKFKAFGGGGEKCAKCGKTVYPAERVEAQKMVMHIDCMRCATCNKKLKPVEVCGHDDGILFCKAHFMQSHMHGGGRASISAGSPESSERRGSTSSPSNRSSIDRGSIVSPGSPSRSSISIPLPPMTPPLSPSNSTAGSPRPSLQSAAAFTAASAAARAASPSHRQLHRLLHPSRRRRRPPPPPPPPPSTSATATTSSAASTARFGRVSGRSSAGGEDPLFAAIRARKEKAEARAAAIAAGEIKSRDPRESFQKKKAAQGGEKRDGEHGRTRREKSMSR